MWRLQKLFELFEQHKPALSPLRDGQITKKSHTSLVWTKEINGMMGTWQVFHFIYYVSTEKEKPIQDSTGGSPKQHCCFLRSPVVNRAESPESSIFHLAFCHHRPSDLSFSSVLKAKLMVVPFTSAVHKPNVPKNQPTLTHTTGWIFLWDSQPSLKQKGDSWETERLDKTGPV